MDSRSGELYKDKAAALEAGVPERYIVEVTGTEKSDPGGESACADGFTVRGGPSKGQTENPEDEQEGEPMTQAEARAALRIGTLLKEKA